MNKRIAIITFFLLSNAYSMNFKMRAREHYQIHDLSLDSGSAQYTGLAPSINFWWEDPYKLSYGFVIDPGLGTYKENKNKTIVNIDKFRQYKIGGEFKYFLAGPLFFRVGNGLSYITSDPVKLWGIFVYGGLGLEIPISNFGLAIEAAYQVTFSERSFIDKAFVPSIGFHFYDLF